MTQGEIDLFSEIQKEYSRNLIGNFIRKTARNIDFTGDVLKTKAKVALGRKLSPENVRTIAKHASLESLTNPSAKSTRDLFRGWAAKGQGAERNFLYYIPK